HDPRAVLGEALRVASRVVAVKDHFRSGWLSEKILRWMNSVGDPPPTRDVRGTSFTPRAWAELVDAAGGRFAGPPCPLQVHDSPFRLVAGDRIHFAASIEHRASGGA